MFGIFGKKENKAPVAPTSSRPVVGSSGIVLDPGFVQVCRLLNYQTTTEPKEVPYSFVSKSFCGVICWDGVIYGGPAHNAQGCVPFGDRHIIRPIQIYGITTDDIRINDNGVEMMFACLRGENNTELGYVCIPVSDFEKFNAAVQQCITDDEDIRKCYGDEVYTYSGSFGCVANSLTTSAKYEEALRKSRFTFHVPSHQLVNWASDHSSFGYVGTSAIVNNEYITNLNFENRRTWAIRLADIARYSISRNPNNKWVRIYFQTVDGFEEYLVLKENEVSTFEGAFRAACANA